MTSFKDFIQYLDDNFIMVIASIIIVLGIASRIINFFRQSVDDQKLQIKEEVVHVTEYIKQCLPDLIIEAEQKYGSGTGESKKSAVFKEILDLLPSIEDYITDGDIDTDFIGKLIDDAVDEINNKIKDDPKLAEIFKQK